MMFEVTQVLSIEGRPPPAMLRLLERHLRASHDVFDPRVEAMAGRIGISVKLGGLNPFFAVGDAARVTVAVMTEIGWKLDVDPLELTVTPRPTMTVMRGVVT